MGHLPITLPLDQTLTRFQGQEGDKSTHLSYLQCMSQIYQESGGLAGFYKGLGAQVVLCLKPAIQFTVFDQIKGIYLKQRAASGINTTVLTAFQAFVLGAIARAIATFVVFPYTRCKMILFGNKDDGTAEWVQHGKDVFDEADADCDGNLTYDELVHFIKTHREGKLAKYFAALLAPLPKEQRKERMERFCEDVAKTDGTTWQIKAGEATGEYHISKEEFAGAYAKVMKQMAPFKAKYDSIPAVFAGVLKDQGVGGLYQGLGPDVGRGLLSAALMLMVKEKLAGIVKGAILSLAKK